MKYKNFNTGKTTDPSDCAYYASFTNATCSARAKPNLPSKLTFLTNKYMEFYMGQTGHLTWSKSKLVIMNVEK